MKEIMDALALMGSGQVEEAVEYLGLILPRANEEEKYVIGELYEEWGYIEEAIKVFDQLLRKYPDEGQLLTKLAQLYIELDEDESALELLIQIEAEDPFYVHSLLLQADAYEREGLVEVAEQKLLEAIEKVGDDERFVVEFALAELLLSTGQAQRAIYFYEKVNKEKDDINGISIQERIAEAYTLIGDYEHALLAYEKISEGNPHLLFKHGMVAYQLKEWNRAIQLWKKALEIDPYYHTIYYELAQAHLEINNLKEAYEVAKEGLTYDEFDKRLYYLIGKVAAQQGEVQEAMNYLKEAIALDEDYKEAILLLANLYEAEDEFDSLIEFIQRVKQAGAVDPLYDWKLAQAYYEKEDFDQASALYDELYFHLRQDPSFLKEYGYFLVEEGALEQAKDILRQYCELQPDDVETIAFLERIHFSNDDEI